ncbi:hypothetical protein [Variovorax guangxiensis]|uniref:hypothetical protein n=1 Tax=Variovorax guangxiensis TaxID=1775474 RepID=UPI002855D701|nr:hypothetical protein [Variovorax guangxiensis]MDR6860517.1 hypothetical protein [Variovorax guangxiensis]
MDVLTDLTHSIQTLHEQGAQRIWQSRNRLQRLLEHSYQRDEKPLILQANFDAEARRALTVEDHQLRQTLRVANGLLVARDGLLGLGDARVLVPEHVGPEPTVDGDLVRRQDIFAQPETGVKEYLVVLVGRVQVMHQADQSIVVEVGQSGLDVAPGRGLLSLAFICVRCRI